jgi:formate/nitrite transporter
MSNFLPPKQLSQEFIAIGKYKATNTISKLFVLGILAGVFIGFAAHFATVVATGWNFNEMPILFGLKKFLVGAAFSVGLMMVMIPGSELWTGNTLMTIALMNKDITLVQMMRNFIVVYIGNFVGSVLLALMIASLTGLTDGPVGGTAINIAYEKVTTGGDMHNIWWFFRAIGCNWLVCLAIMMAISAKDISGKILAIFFPIMAFVSSGFEHIIANMYFIPAGIFSKAFGNSVIASGKTIEILNSLNWVTMITQNFIVVTVGNFIGGGIFCGVIYWWLYVRE